jgi:hypothetical protein
MPDSISENFMTMCVMAVSLSQVGLNRCGPARLDDRQLADIVSASELPGMLIASTLRPCLS